MNRAVSFGNSYCTGLKKSQVWSLSTPRSNARGCTSQTNSSHFTFCHLHLSQVSAAFLFTDNSYPCCGTSCTKLHPSCSYIHCRRIQWSKTHLLWERRSSKSIHNKAKVSLFCKYEVASSTFPVVSFGPSFHRITGKAWVGSDLKNQPLPCATIPPSRSGCSGPHPTFCSIPDYSCTAGICRCWFTASQHAHI